MGLFINLGSLLSGKGGKYNGQFRSKPFQELLYTTVNDENYLGNWARQMSGSALTDAEREANAFNALQAQLNRDFQQSMFNQQTELANSAYQRQVLDMQAAGINPMLAVSGSGGAAISSPGSGATASSVSPGASPLNLGSLLSAVSGLQVNSAQAALMRAEADKARADTDKVRSETDFFNSMKSVRRQAETLQNQLTEKEIDKGDAIIKELAARADNELSQAVYNRANTRNLEYLQPFVAKELESRSTANEANAKYALVQAAYQQGLIDEGIVAASVRLVNAKASEAEVNALVGKFMAALSEKEVHNTPDIITGSIGEKIVGVINAASKAIQGKLK